MTTNAAERFRNLLASLREKIRNPAPAPCANTPCTNDQITIGFRRFVDGVRACPKHQRYGPLIPNFFPDQGQVDAFHRVLTAIQTAFYRDLPARLGEYKVEVLKRYLQLPAPSVLEIFRKVRDENAHTDVQRWLLDPVTAPTVAPAALHKLVEVLDEPEKWQALLKDAIAIGCLSVRREVVFRNEGGRADDLDRIDLLISGPTFLIAIENKIGSDEHDGQTPAYWSWLQGRKPLRTAGIFLTPLGLPAQSPSFRRVSYFDLLSCLLEGPSKAGLKAQEGVVLAGYLKTLADHVLGYEFRALVPELRGGAQ